MDSGLRVALFTDSFHEANGVGTLTQEFAHFARTENLPFCCVYGGDETKPSLDGSLLTLQLKRSSASFPMDAGLYCDPLLSRYRNYVVERVRAFQPDLIHITGPGDLGILGFWVSHVLGVPMVASWHTNLHEYLFRRLSKTLAFLPPGLRNGIAASGRNQSLRALSAFYRLAHFIVAPNAATVDLLHARTGRPCYPMAHGVDVSRFSPARRARESSTFCIGYVGRLTPEKNVRALVDLERRLQAAGQNNFRLLLAGEGSECAWLRRNLTCADLPGRLRGERLATAFANMDVFVFPSMTDTFGLVLLEAMASGVPVVASADAGMRAGVRDGVTGLLSDDFAGSVLQLIDNTERRREMGAAARCFACTHQWSSVFQELYRTYERALASEEVRRRMSPAYRLRALTDERSPKATS